MELRKIEDITRAEAEKIIEKARRRGIRALDGTSSEWKVHLIETLLGAKEGLMLTETQLDCTTGLVVHILIEDLFKRGFFPEKNPDVDKQKLGGKNRL